MLGFFIAASGKPTEILLKILIEYRTSCMSPVKFGSGFIVLKAALNKCESMMLTFYWESHCPIYCDFIDDQWTFNSQYNSKMLEHKDAPTISSIRCGLFSKRVIFQHDNARPHVFLLIPDELQKLGLGVMLHPAYSSDIARLIFTCLNHSKTP